jgi:hypothetical protein
LLPGSFPLYTAQIHDEENEGDITMPEKLAIGVPGGFVASKPRERVEEDLSLAVMPAEIIIPLPCDQLPSAIADSIASIQVRCTLCIDCNNELYRLLLGT